MSRIILIGYMGVGKTTIGRPLAQALGMPFYDLDWCLESRYHKKASQLFLERGEDAFRRMERAMLHEVAEFENVVISCGGGTPCFFDNMGYMLGQATVVWLKAAPDVIFAHLHMSRNPRPMFVGMTDNQMRAKIEEQLNERKQYYEQAHLSFDVSLMDNRKKIINTVEQLRELLTK